MISCTLLLTSTPADLLADGLESQLKAISESDSIEMPVIFVRLDMAMKIE